MIQRITADVFKASRRVTWTLPLASSALCWLIAPPNRLDWVIWVAFVPLFAWLPRGGLSTRQVLVGTWLVGSSYYLAISHPLLSLSWWAWGSVSSGPQYAAFIWHQKLFILLIITSLSVWGGLLWAVCGWLTKRYAATPLRAL